MARKSAVEDALETLEQASGGEDPWLLSYADLVTNLLAFMVLLVSISGFSFTTSERVSSLFSSADQAETMPLETLSTEIQKLAEQEGLAGKVRAIVDTKGLAIHLQDRILFPSGVADLSQPGRSLVRKLARMLNSLPDRYLVAVEGHTDDIPISTPKFPSNWELSAARALKVRGQLASAGVAEARLSIMAYADTRPSKEAVTGTVSDPRSKNRRVVIRVHY